MTTAKWTINTGVQQDFLPYPAARVNEKGCFAGVGVEMLKIFLLQPSGPGYKRSFIPPHIHTFVLLAQDLTKDNNPHTFWGIQASLLQ